MADINKVRWPDDELVEGAIFKRNSEFYRSCDVGSPDVEIIARPISDEHRVNLPIDHCQKTNTAVTIPSQVSLTPAPFGLLTKGQLASDTILEGSTTVPVDSIANCPSHSGASARRRRHAKVVKARDNLSSL